MATCDMGFEHEETAVVAEPEPVVVNPGPNENEVKIAEIEAAASIEREKIWTQAQENDLAQQNEALRGELRGIRETLATLIPPADPEPPAEPVVVPVPAAEPAEAVAAPPETKAPKSGKTSSGWWDNYA